MRATLIKVFTFAAIALLGVLLLWRSFSIPQRLPAVPDELAMRAVIPGIPNARYWVGLDIEPFVRDVAEARKREAAYLARSGHTGKLPPLEILAISGGGDRGAFGAGFLNGWTATSTRPEFKAVTGISTGALIAPYAFLGPEYDDELKAIYTTISPADVAQKRSILAAVQNDAMADNRPLWDLISRHADQALLDAIAREHERGRILLIGTTNLDARHPIIWNMGAIAASGAPVALELFRRILLASAAIPGAFPPTMIPVEVDGKPYQEMHVDGGAAAQVFLYPPRMVEVAESMGLEVGAGRTGTLYILRNAQLGASWEPVERRTISIANRAISSLIHSQGIGDLYRIYVTAQRDRLDFNLAYVEPDFKFEGKKEEFDPPFMIALYDYGYRKAAQSYGWQKTPPGM